MLIIDTSRYKALLFDFDGTLVDSEPIHYESMSRTLAEHNKKYVSFDNHKKMYMGTGLHNVALSEKNRHGLKVDVEDIKKSFNSHLKNLIETRGIPPMAGIIKLLNEAKSKGLRLAVVSGSTTELVRYTLEKSGIPNLFDEVIGIDKFITPKPDPSCYLLTAEKLGVKSSESLVFEEAENGIKAAVDAGMEVVVVGDNIKEEAIKSFKKIQRIRNFKEIGFAN